MSRSPGLTPRVRSTRTTTRTSTGATPVQDADFVEEVVRRHQGSVRGYLVYLGCSPSMLDDLIQEVFLSFFASRFEYRGDAAAAAFLRQVARNLFLKALRRQRSEPATGDLAAAEGAWIEFQGEDEGQSYLEALRKCLATLGAKARDVLRRRYQDRAGRAEIAEALGLSQSGVKSILVRSKKALRTCIERRLAG